MAEKKMIDGAKLLELLRRHKDHSYKSLVKCRMERDTAVTKESAEELRRWTFQFSGECGALDNVIAVVQTMMTVDIAD